MTLLFYCLLYAGGIVFLAGCAVRAVRYARQPIHLRWEIYPVPHGRSGELRVMLPEILLLKGLWEFNRPLWCVSYPFHLGLYLLAAACAAAFVLPPAARIAGGAGLALILAGSLGLAVRRLTQRELRIYTHPADIFHLAWFAATAAGLLAGTIWRPAGAPGPIAIVRGAATFDTTLPLPGLLAAAAASGIVLLAYIPMTHMAHFVAKYFTYHQVRWDERALVPGGSIEKQMAEYLTYRPTWSAPHVGAGSRTWAEIATSNPARGRDW